MASELALLNNALIGDPERAPVKVVQFGTGAFLKGFINAIFDDLNQRPGAEVMGIAAVKLRAGNEQQIDQINTQDGLFTLNVSGLRDGEVVNDFRIIQSQVVALSPYQDEPGFNQLSYLPELQWLVSNSTEAGIVYDERDIDSSVLAQSFPGKLTQFLYRRWQHFDGVAEGGLNILCCELIADNGSQLRQLVQRYANSWQLPPAFAIWIDDHCLFLNTLVDRIVPGKPALLQSKPDYIDNELIECETYYLLAIECNARSRPVLEQWLAGLAEHNIVLTEDLQPYRERKVKILNGGHTAVAPIAALLRIPLVLDAMCDEQVSLFMSRLMHQEIAATFAGHDPEVVRTYIETILQRFRNPFLQHKWRDILLNTLSKWRIRLLPALAQYCACNDLPPRHLVAAVAALLIAYRSGSGVELRDEPDSLEALAELWQQSGSTVDVVRGLFSHSALLAHAELAQQGGLHEIIANAIDTIDAEGLRGYLTEIL